MNAPNDNWLINFPSSRANPKLQLICFPFAGGGSLNYGKWRGKLSSEIDLYAFNIPGRERFFKQECLTNYYELIKGMVALIENQPTYPMIFLGHSFGALSAYFTALELKKRNRIAPMHLYLSARIPPGTGSLEKIGDLSQSNFKSVLIERYQGIPQKILSSPELLDMFIRIIQKDFRMYEQYPQVYNSFENHILDCDITSISYDKDIPKTTDFLDWKNHTTGTYNHIQLPGGHFEIINNDALIIDIINQRTNKIQ